MKEVNGERTADAEANNNKFSQLLDKKLILKGLRYFIFLSVAGLTVLFFYTSTPDTVKALTQLEVKYLLLAMALSAFDLWIGGYRNHIFVRKIKPDVHQLLCFRANIANLFMGSVTPSQSGGGPAQLFVLYRGGIPLPGAISVSVINFLSTLVFFLLAASFAMFFVQQKFSQVIVQYLIRYGFFIFAFLAALFAIALWRPDLIGMLIEKITAFLRNRSGKMASQVARIGEMAVNELDRYHEICTNFIKREPHLLPFSFVLTIVMYVNKFVLAYFVMRGLGVDADFMQMMAIQAMILFILYFSPSPGGSGIAELSTGALMSTIMPAYLLPVFTLLQRFFLLYMPAALGALVVMGELRPKENEPVESESQLIDAVERPVSQRLAEEN
ncbi:MAG: flippase-like domain-containing protein [Deferribacteres bacterium]|nr:flippase-like domain-containing protein [candidate division KSB1 bacterium]MCB9510555.1 flippase-like domain-containing protein [Deferribacteres bacterium]